MEETPTYDYPSPPARSLQEYLGILLKRRWAALSVFITLVVTVILYSFTATPIYQATTQLLIEPERPRILEGQEVIPVNSGSAEFYQTQYKLLESRALASKVVDKLHLENHPVYREIFASLPKDAEPAQRQQAQERLISAILASLEVTPVRNSSLVEVSFNDPDPQLASRLVNTLAQAYIEQSLELRFAAAQETATWLQKKIAEGRQKLEDSESKLNQYKRTHNIVTWEDKESITAQKLGQLNQALVEAQTKRLEVETRYNQVSQGQPISEVLDNPVIQALKGQEAALIAQQSEMALKFGPKHPKMIQLANELAAIRGKMGAEMGTVVQTIKNQYQMAVAQEDNLKAALEAQKDQTQELGDKAVQYRVLLRDVETNRALYDNLVKTLKETTATQNIPATNIKIVYPAAVPSTPVKPRKTRNTMLAALMGLVLGAGLALTLERLDNTFKTPQEVEAWLEIPNLALIPHLEGAEKGNGHQAPQLVIHHQPRHLVSEAYRGLRTNILFSTPGQSPRVLLVTSAMPLEGKSVTAVNLASAMAQAEPDVLLVDSDLRRPTIHHYLEIDKEPGLSNFLVGDIDTLPVVETQVPHLFVVPSGPTPPNPSELLGSERMREFLRRARERFGQIILDSPPLTSVTDAAILASLAEGTLFVVKAEAVNRKTAQSAREQLQGVQAHVLGAILNDVPIQRDGYYYQYYYHRYYTYYTSEDGTRTRRHAQRAALGMPQRWLNRLKKQLGLHP
ncbi:MAG: polysaccharide biosynthesis tyrosine autokinase [Desulfobacca sp.]|nr:polysaccharide biosynthesis tyrosine autokinase [Desulfobacca sp.]